MNERPMTVKEVAEFLSISEYTVAEYLRAGKLKGFKLGNSTGKKGNKRRWLVWKRDLLIFLGQHEERH